MQSLPRTPRQAAEATNNRRRWLVPLLIGFAAFVLLHVVPSVIGPSVTAKSIYVVTVDDALTRDTDLATAKLLGDLDYWLTVEARGHKRRQLDWNPSTPTPESLPYQPFIQQHGLPLIVLLSDDPDAKGKVLYAGKLHSERGPPGVDELLNAYTRK